MCFVELSVAMYAAPPCRCGQVRDGGTKIGRITSAGTITEYPIPTPNSAPWDVALGPDGALWFTESENYRTGAKIGRITTAGVITEYPLPQTGSYPHGIVAGHKNGHSADNPDAGSNADEAVNV